MIVDTSALIAIAFREPESERFVSAIQSSNRPSVSAVTIVETTAVFVRREGPDAAVDVPDLLATLNIEVEPFTVSQAEVAAEAYVTYGKGVHRAGLNFGDCCVYALAKSLDQPLLFKGNDFIHTDIEAALA